MGLGMDLKVTVYYRDDWDLQMRDGCRERRRDFIEHHDQRHGSGGGDISDDSLPMSTDVT